jgi:glycosyltransferase involved in cell wall biosynthesis
MVVDTGDAIYELSRSSGERGPLGLWLTKLLERFALSVSSRIVVRSHGHQELLAMRGIMCDVIPDGVDISQFCPRPQPGLRREHNLEGSTVIGIMGSLMWNRRLQMCYGWELLEVIDKLRDRPVKGVIIGDGSGLPELKRQCAVRRLEERIVFMGRIPYDDLPPYLNLMDICLSTQTNDIVGQVRTTGKLPLYLACGRFVLASAVGEAARVLPPDMLVPYNGTKDCDYPDRLAGRVQSLLEAPDRLQQREASVGIAQAHFDYDVLAARLRQTIQRLLTSCLAEAGEDAFVPTGSAPHDGAGCRPKSAGS